MPHIGFDLRQRFSGYFGSTVKPFIESRKLEKGTADDLSGHLCLSGCFAWDRVVGIHPCSDYSCNCSQGKRDRRFKVPYGWVNGPWSVYGFLSGLSLKTTSLMITIGKVHLNAGNQVHWFQFPSIAHPPCWATFLPCPPNQDFSGKKISSSGWKEVKPL